MKIFIATTLCDGKMHGKCSLSLVGNITELMRNGHIVSPYFAEDLYIDHSRNFCSKVFLESDCDVLVFVDADLKFDSDAILKLIKHDKEIVAGAYRYKKDGEEYPIILDFSHGGNCKDEENGLVYVESAPTGLMKIKRSAFETMRAHYGLKPDSKGLVPFFDTGLRMGDNEWWGEDSYFCKRWRDMGMEMFVEPTINFTHIGYKEYTGNYHEYLMGRSVSRMDNVESGVPGWMTDNELALLKYFASRCEDVIEIGSWKGRSTKALLEGCKGTVYAIDHWNGTDTDSCGMAAFGLNVYEEFMKNVGDYPNLKVCRGDSGDIVKKFRGKADLVFIDAGHSYAEAKADIERWLPHCGKIIAGHDWCDGYPGVAQAVGELLGDVHVIDTIWFKEL